MNKIDLPIICVSDIHGCYYTLIRLLNKCPSPARLFLLGDLIDRGPHSRLVVEFAMNNGIPTCMGNHESLCLDFYNRKSRCSERYSRGVWLDNGGDKAVKNWTTIDARGADTPAKWQLLERDRYIGGRVPDSVLDWMEGLPPYIVPAASEVGGRRLLLSHTGYGLRVDQGDWFTALWGRYHYGDGPFAVNPENGDEIDDRYYRVFGHTPAKSPMITENYANIDTGAAYASRGGGVMTAFVWPLKQCISQTYDESVTSAQFRMSSGGVYF